MSDSRQDFDAKIAAQAARKLKAQRAGTQSAWFGLGMVGVIGCANAWVWVAQHNAAIRRESEDE